MDAKRQRLSRVKRFIPVATVAVVVATMAGAIAVTTGNSGNQSVVLVNKQDGKAESRSGYQTAKNMSDAVDNQNAAAATSADCTGCRTVAVAVQVVLAENDPSTVTPANIALAINQNCTGCETAAFAYQYVITTRGPSHFSPDGNQTIAELRRQIEAVADSGAPLFEIDARLDSLVDQMWSTVDSELVETGIEFRTRELEDSDVATEDDTSPSPSVSPSESASPTPTESVSPAPTESVAPGTEATPTTDPTTDPGGDGTTTDSSSEPTSEPSESPSESPTPTPTEASSPAPEPSGSP